MKLITYTLSLLLLAIVSTKAVSENEVQVSSNSTTSQCLCLGASVQVITISCTNPDGSTFKKQQKCWTKKNSTTGEPCGTVCESAVNVCSGTPGVCQ